MLQIVRPLSGWIVGIRIQILTLCCREGCTAIVVCQQPTTDMCSFFSSAYILVSGEVVYFGDTGAQAVDLLMSAGMPCPPLYSPVEQYMRLVDPSFEVSFLPHLQSYRMSCLRAHTVHA